MDYRAPDYLEKLMALTDGTGRRCNSGNARQRKPGEGSHVLAKSGRIVVIGNRGTIEINPRDAMSRDATILGMTLFNAADAELISIHARLAAG